MKRPLQFIIVVLIVLGIFVYAFKEAKKIPPIEPTMTSEDYPLFTEPLQTPPEEWPCEPFPECKG